MTYENLNKIIKEKILQTLLSCDKHCQHFDKHPSSLIYRAYTCTTHAPTQTIYAHQSHTPGTNMQTAHTIIHTHNECMCTHTVHIQIICTFKQGSTLFSSAHCMHILCTHIICTLYTHITHTHTHIDLRNRLTLKSTFLICFFSSTHVKEIIVIMTTDSHHCF